MAKKSIYKTVTGELIRLDKVNSITRLQERNGKTWFGLYTDLYMEISSNEKGDEYNPAVPAELIYLDYHNLIEAWIRSQGKANIEMYEGNGMPELEKDLKVSKAMVAAGAVRSTIETIVNSTPDLSHPFDANGNGTMTDEEMRSRAKQTAQPPHVIFPKVDFTSVNDTERKILDDKYNRLLAKVFNLDEAEINALAKSDREKLIKVARVKLEADEQPLGNVMLICGKVFDVTHITKIGRIYTDSQGILSFVVSFGAGVTELVDTVAYKYKGNTEVKNKYLRMDHAMLMRCFEQKAQRPEIGPARMYRTPNNKIVDLDRVKSIGLVMQTPEECWFIIDFGPDRAQLVIDHRHRGDKEEYQRLVDLRNDMAAKWGERRQFMNIV